MGLVAVAKYSEDVEFHRSGIIYAIKVWLQMVKLDQVGEKTKAVLITSRRKNNNVKILVQN